MGKGLSPILAEEIDKAKELRKQAKTALEHRQAISVLLLAYGLTTYETADLLGIDRHTLRRDREAVRRYTGKQWKEVGGRRNALMPPEEETSFLSQWSSGITDVKAVHCVLMARLGRSIPLSSVYRLLARHGWKRLRVPGKRLGTWFSSLEYALAMKMMKRK